LRAGLRPPLLLLSLVVFAGLFLAVHRVSAAVVESVELQGTRARFALETAAGNEYDRAAIRRDVRRLWRSGAFDDIRVETGREAEQVRVVFRVIERPRFLLRAVQFDPPGENLKLTIEKGDPVTAAGARDAGRSLEEQLAGDGFPAARVEAVLMPVGAGQADLVVRIERGAKVRFGEVELSGALGVEAADLRKSLKATAPRRWLPGIPGVWQGCVRRAPYNPDSIESDLAALRSLYVAEGYLSATVGLDQVQLEGNRANVAIRVDAGPRYQISNASIETPQDSVAVAAPAQRMLPKLCHCLLAERAKAEREGRLDFNVRLEWEPLEETVAPTAAGQQDNGPQQFRAHANGSGTAAPAIDRRVALVAKVEPGRQYRVRRIEFRGNNTLRDATLRRALAIDEGDWLDPQAIRKSLASLSRFDMMAPLSETDVEARQAVEGAVDLTFSVREHKHGRWSVSGPLGPVRLFGPLRFAVESRLPPWGRGVLDLSTWLASFGVLSYTDPVARILSGDTQTLWSAFVALRRPLLPGQEATSGFLLSPTLGWRDHLIYAALLHGRPAADRALQPAGTAAAPLAATYGRREMAGPPSAQPQLFRVNSTQRGMLLCKPQRSRFDWLRSGVRVLLDLALGVS
jgi:hypothetical protein